MKGNLTAEEDILIAEKEKEEKDEKDTKDEKEDEKESSGKPKKGEMPPQFKKNAEKVAAKAKAKKDKLSDEDENEEEELDESFDIQINATIPDSVFETLGDNETVTEAFVKEHKNLIEAILVTKLDEIKTQVSKQANERIAQKVTALEESTIENIDKYLTYCAEEWADKNALAIETGIKNEVMEKFIGDIHRVFSENNINIPEERVDVLEQMTAKIQKLENDLNDQIERNISMKEENENLVREGVIVECCESFTDVEREKVKDLTSMLEFGDRDTFKERVTMMIENYGGGSKKGSGSKSGQSKKSLVENTEIEGVEVAEVLNEKVTKTVSSGKKNVQESAKNRDLQDILLGIKR